MWNYNYTRELYHHGIKGQKWGVRRFQNPDGSLTAVGRKRYGTAEALEGHQKMKTAKKKREAKDLQNQSPDVKRYLETWDRAEELDAKSDEVFSKAKEEYKALGNNAFARISEVSKAQKGKGSKAAEHYLKTWERAEELDEQSRAEFQRAQEQYKKLGQTYVERIITVSKYDSE